MNRGRIRQAMRRAGIVPSPLAHITDAITFSSAASQLSDAALLHAFEVTAAEYASSLSDDELLHKLAAARAAIPDPRDD